MFTLSLSKTTRMIFDRLLGRFVSNERPAPDRLDCFNNTHQDFMNRVQRIFAERGYEKVHTEKTLNSNLVLFTQSKTVHLVYCLLDETYVTTIEVQACWEAQCRFGAESSTVVVPHRFSKAAIDKAWKLGIELLAL